MYHQTDRKPNNRQFQEAASQRKAANDTQYFWELYNRHLAGHSIGPIRRISKAQEEAQLFGKKTEDGVKGVIDDNIPVQRSGPRSEEIKTIETFTELNNVLPPYVTRCLELLKFDGPTPIQKHSIPLGLAGLDLMCCAQTGSGKTLAFLIPVITALDPNATARRAALMKSHSEASLEECSTTEDLTTNSSVQSDYVSVDMRGVLPRAIVLAPTRELASQIHLDARRLTFNSTIKCVCVYGGNDIRSQLVELCTGCDLIVATPGRLNDLVDRGVVSLCQVSFLVLDEADRMLDMGFEPQIRRIVLEYDMPRGEDRQTFMFSATFPSEIQTLAREFLRNYVWIAVGRVGSTVDNIKQQVLLSSSDPNEKTKLLMSVLDQTNGRTLVFVQKRKTASWLCETLRNLYGISAEEIHGDRSQAQRENALRLFRDGNIRILVGTDVAARGLDVPAVMHVIQFDMPLSSEDFDVYVHRIGRTGRAGMSGLATSFFVPGREIGEGNGKIAGQLHRLLQENSQEVPEWFTSLDDVYSSGNNYNQGRRPNNGNYQNYKSNNRFGYQDNRSNQNTAIYQPNTYQNKAGNAQYAQSNDYGANRNNYYQRSQPSMNANANPRVNSNYYQQYNNAQPTQIAPQLQSYMAYPTAGSTAYGMQGGVSAAAGVYPAQSGGYYDPYSGTYIPGNAAAAVNNMEAFSNQFANVSLQQQWVVPTTQVASAQGFANQGQSHAMLQGNNNGDDRSRIANQQSRDTRGGGGNYFAAKPYAADNYQNNGRNYNNYNGQNFGYGNQEAQYANNGYGAAVSNSGYAGKTNVYAGNPAMAYGNNFEATEADNSQFFEESEKKIFDNNLAAPTAEEQTN